MAYRHSTSGFIPGLFRILAINAVPKPGPPACSGILCVSFRSLAFRNMPQPLHYHWFCSRLVLRLRAGIWLDRRLILLRHRTGCADNLTYVPAVHLLTYIAFRVATSSIMIIRFTGAISRGRMGLRSGPLWRLPRLRCRRYPIATRSARPCF